ncbi:MAG TPA: hypothetical protein PKJ19_03480 [Flavobacteriales bacterium]|nr:hypothetical protein [Flavobacteriales bacterium]
MANPTPAQLQAFITKWELSGAAERANAHLFIAELCDVIGVPHPEPKQADERVNAYVFEKPVPSANGTTNFIDLYKRGCFVLETKQGVDTVGTDEGVPLSSEGQQRLKERKTGHGKRGTKGFDTAMIRAHAQAQRYARALPKEEIPDGRPPFVVVVDVGHSISLYTDWSRMGGEYLPFPDPASYRIPLKKLLDQQVRETLRAVWTEPLTLDPARRSAKVTREIADRLAKLAKTLEGKHDPEHVAAFLMRCLFTMFSEDVELLPLGSFTKLLGELKGEPENFQPMLENLWGTMNTGGLSPILRKKLPRFNGGLFAHADAIALNADQIQLLIEASTANWKDVEPAIFGTLLERALDPRERHKLGAHYTPRAYVERLVNPTVIEPLREQWRGVQVAALQLHDAGDDKKAIKLVEDFLHQLATVRVLDPACGSGNFLYVTLELLKRLEGEVLNTLHELGATSKLELEGVMVTPANFFGIELNPRAAAIAEQVLWIGFLQWHLRTHGHLHNLPEPIIKDLHNIECRDAVLDYDARTELRDADGNVVTKWDGRTTKPHPVTGQEVPDPEAREPMYTYTKPRPAQWPEVDYIVGNPPFIGVLRMREALGDGYTEALRRVYDNVPDSADFVMYWWDKAAEATRLGMVKRFGLITTNSLKQTFNRKVLQHHMDAKKPISLAFAIPDHPWVDSADGAAVRVAMTIGVPGLLEGTLRKVTQEIATSSDDAAEVVLANEPGLVQADLTVGAKSIATTPLRSNQDLGNRGMLLVGDGFVVDAEIADRLGRNERPNLRSRIVSYHTAMDIVRRPASELVIDMHGLSDVEMKASFPEVYQWLLTRVKPARDENRDPYRNQNWWLHGRPHDALRSSIRDLKRYIATPMTAKHRLFVFLPGGSFPDQGLIAFGLDDGFYLGVMSSRIHIAWSLARGGTLEDRPRYNNSVIFETFPFPACTPAQQEKIRALGEQLDAHRKRQQALHPELTMTGMYNVLEAVRSGAALTAKEKKIYEQGLVGILKQLHNELDAAVAEAYGWPTTMATDEILSRLVALNAERAAEEAQGHVRWLRPEYQNAGAGAGAKGKQAKLDITPAAAPAPSTTSVLREWPNELPAQAAALAAVLEEMGALCTVPELAAHFSGKATPKRLREMEQLLNTLAAVGRAREWKGKWAGV